MPVLETKIFGSTIEINYREGEKEKLIDLIDRFKKRLLEFKDLQGKVTDSKILFLAALKTEDHIFDLNEKFIHQNKEKVVSKNLNLDLDNKIFLLAALKAEDHIFDLNEKFLLQNEEKIVSKDLSLELNNKVKEIVKLKDNILILNKENKRLKDLNDKVSEEINKINKKLSDSIKNILFEINNNDFN